MSDPLENLRYPISVFRRQDGPYEEYFVSALGAATDGLCAKKEFRHFPNNRVSRRSCRETLNRKMTEAQMDQCARECRNLWGPIWDQIWREVWELNSEAMAEERVKAIKEYFR